jgi:hypothetical protein
MPIACSQTVLTGSEGSIWFQPAGTQFCLLDFTDFPVGTLIKVPADNDFRVGDPVVFTEEGDNSKLTDALTPGDTYYVVARTMTSISVSETPGGLAIPITATGGSGTADTPGADNHIGLDFAEFAAVCQVKTFQIDLSREELDTTVLPCGVGVSSTQAPFRTMQAGYASGTGTMSVQFTSEQNSLANRLLSNSMRKNQGGAEVRLYVNTVDDGTGKPDDTKSLFIQAPISIMGFSLSVAPEEVTVAELNFSVSGQPTRLFV